MKKYLLFFVCLSYIQFIFANPQDNKTLENKPEDDKVEKNSEKNLPPASTMEIEYQNEKNLFLARFANYIALYEPSYILPFYYTASPDYAVYPQSEIPGNQTLKKGEFKAQLSVYLPLIKNLFYNKNVSINVSYTQLVYWQLYTSSPWFRETNYEPAITLRGRFMRNFFGDLTIDHQSNGRGGVYERSWNRVIGRLEYGTPNFFMRASGWVLLFKGMGATTQNPDIAHYLGYDELILSYRFFNRLVTSVQASNFESGFKRGSIILTAFYPFTTKVGAYFQFFSGYGQSLIEYNHRTQSVGIGVALNDWQ